LTAAFWFSTSNSMAIWNDIFCKPTSMIR